MPVFFRRVGIAGSTQLKILISIIPLVTPINATNHQHTHTKE